MPTIRPIHLSGCALALALSTATPLAGQESALGAYQGTIEFEGTRTNPEVRYKARLTLTMPISEADGGRVSAEFLAGEAPEGRLELIEWEESDTQTSADSDANFTGYRCSLPGAVMLPVTVSGVVNVDPGEGGHSFSITALTTQQAELSCTNSRSGPYTLRKGFALTTGTGVPGQQWEKWIPNADATRLQGEFTLDPSGYTRGAEGPIVQRWSFARVR